MALVVHEIIDTDFEVFLKSLRQYTNSETSI